MEKIPLKRIAAGFAVAYAIFVIPAIFIGYHLLLDSPHQDIIEAEDPEYQAFIKVFIGVSVSGLIVMLIGLVMFAIYEKSKLRSKKSYLIGGFVAGCVPGLPINIITIFIGMLMTYAFWKIAIWPSVKQVTNSNN